MKNALKCLFEMSDLEKMELLLVKKVNIEKSAQKSRIHSFQTPANP